MASREFVYLNGEIVPHAEAKISVEDRGFNFAESLYEVVRIVGGHAHHIEAHLDRLENGARALEIELPLDRVALRDNMVGIAVQNGVEEGIVYLQLTRGVAPRSHAPPSGMEPTLLMFARPYPGPDDTQVKSGVSVITAPDLRWGYCEIKTTGLLPNILAFKHAKSEGCHEAVMVRDGVVTEATRSSVFCVRGDTVYTHPVDNILPGITRKFLIESLRDAGVRVEESPVRIEDFRASDEIFLTGTATEVLPVVELDRAQVGQGVPGPVTRRARELYLAGVEATRAGASA